MPDVGFLPAELVALLIGSGVAVLAYSLGGRICLWAIVLFGLLLNQVWMLSQGVLEDRLVRGRGAEPR